MTFKNLTTKIARVSGIWIFVLGMLSATAVQAHNSLQNSSPAEGAVMHEVPSAVSLTFSSSTYLETLEVINDQGINILPDFNVSIQAAKSFSLELPESLATGIYTVKWMVVGNDTHQIKGQFSFTVNTMVDEHAGMSLYSKEEGHGQVAHEGH